MRKICVLKNPIQDYAWGSRTIIPELMGDPVPSEKPQAELWMGVHPTAPSQVLCNGEWISLPEFIGKDPEGILGGGAAKKFSKKLPFLFKVLAAAKPLSIQAHPNKDQGREGFARENGMKIPLGAPNRNYRDENHKPEIICALTPFWLLNGFRKIDNLIALIERIGAPALKDKAILLQGQHEAEGLKFFLTALMTMDQGTQRQLVTEVVHHCEELSATDPGLEWIVKLNQEYPGDMGVLSPIFMNLVQLQPGEALYTPAGRLHAYLEGAGVELMANSDNVLRGGLTAKTMDVPELLKILDFTPNEVDILEPERRESGEEIYRTPAKEFLLSVISLVKDFLFESIQERSVEIMMCLEGDARVTNLGTGDALSLTKGTAIIVPAAVERYHIEGEANIYKATVPP
ncbi:MAG: mannose-6-phosphate isomerase, class I [Desulfobacteraceae bacterium]|jgi:mannose-6-phosphate isomerase